uniref:Uncharacterized protein n=1 Tax=Anopheles minimus TaxID=112268 RepID=A0A182W791_9DIPT
MTYTFLTIAPQKPTSLIGQVSLGLHPQPTDTVSNLVAQSLQYGATTTTPPFGTIRLEEVSTVPLWLEAQLAQQNPPERPQGPSVSFVPAVALSSTMLSVPRPVVDGAGNQNFDPAGTGQLTLDSVYDGPTTTGRALAGRRPTTDNGFDELPTAPPPVVVNRFGDDDANGRPSIAPVPAVPAVVTTTTQRPTTTTVRQTRPATRQTTTRNTQRTTTRFITRVPQTPPPTRPPTTITTTRTSTILQQRPFLPPQPSPAQQQPILPPQAPPQTYPTIIYERPQAPPRASPPPPPTQALPPTAPARPFYVPPEPPRTPPTQYGVQTTPDSIIDHFFVPPSQAANPPPIVGLWNQLGTKIADTADAIAGMLQKTVDVLVSSHIQSHQRALRRI